MKKRTKIKNLQGWLDHLNSEIERARDELLSLGVGDEVETNLDWAVSRMVQADEALDAAIENIPEDEECEPMKETT